MKTYTLFSAALILAACSGSEGPPGQNGTNGQNGNTGMEGPAGVKGVQGPVGPEGEAGPPGSVDASTLVTLLSEAGVAISPYTVGCTKPDSGSACELGNDGGTYVQWTCPSAGVLPVGCGVYFGQLAPSCVEGQYCPDVVVCCDVVDGGITP